MNSIERKPSRYRSVRNAQNNPAAAAVQKTTDPASTDDNATGTINRSRSRYHRKPQQPSHNESPPLPNSPESLHTSPVRPAGPRAEPHSHEYDNPNTFRARAATSPERTMTQHAEAERQRRLQENSASRQGSAASRGAVGPTPTYSARKSDPVNRHDSPIFDDAPMRRSDPPSQAPQQIIAGIVRPEEHKSASCFSGLFRRKKPQAVLQPSEKVNATTNEPQFIKHGGGGIVPGLDAPKSAVNSGGRRVSIEFNRSSMQFPVDTGTTAAELLQSAANCFSDPIDPKTFVLVEVFDKAGVQRPLRRYEHVREVMNSWDDDMQNTLMVMPADALGADPALLHASNAPQVRPSEKSFVVYYSQKVGKWDRRHIVVRNDGQVVAKKNSTAADKDATNVCHLSDFDIYTPTQRQTAKKIHPPKKLCFAIKSQQKTSMFEATSDFVHFFCTGEREEADAFYHAIQTWRSWYLISMKGEGRRQPVQQPDPFKTSPTRNKSVKKATHNRDQSMESAYQLGSFKPLIESEKMDLHPSSSEEEPIKPIARSTSKRERTHQPPVLPPQQLSEDEPLVNLLDKRNSLDSPLQSTFATSGLLGRSYSQRQRDVAAKEATTSQAFTNGPSLLSRTADHRPDAGAAASAPRRNQSTRHSTEYRNSVDLRRQGSTRRAADADPTDLSRSATVRAGGPSKPLVDLTPTYREPPQFARKQNSGRGFVPATAGPLVDAVPSPEDPLGLPASTDWRGRRSASDAQQQSGADQRGTSASRAPPRARSSSRNRDRGGASSVPQAPRFQNTAAYAALTGAPDPVTAAAPPRDRQLSGGSAGSNNNGGGGGGNGAFVPGGLLEHAAGGWGAGDKGRGVVGTSGGRSGKPLVDLGQQDIYGKGSLLERQARAEREE